MGDRSRDSDHFRAGTDAARERAERASRANRSPRSRANRPHPATSELGYTDDEWEFIKAMDAYQRETGSRIPAWSEVLEVFIGLGYAKPAECPPPPDDVPR